MNDSMTKYKLTTQDLTTHNGCQWEVGVAKKTDGTGDLCGTGWLHYYHDPLLAVLLNPGHADIKNPRLWEVKADGKHKDDHGLKGGCTKMTLIREIPLPEVTTTQRVAFGILCAKEVCTDKKWNVRADKWLSGEDRSEKAARASVAWSAVAAAEIAARAAWATSEASEAWETSAARAARAARAAVAANIDLIALARKAIEVK